MKKLTEKLETLLELGGMRKDIVCLILSGAAVLCSLVKFQPFPFDIAWIAIVLCGLPIVLEAIIGLVTSFVSIIGGGIAAVCAVLLAVG